MTKHHFTPQPAKVSGMMNNGERIEAMADDYRLDFKTPRAMTKDLCDFCLRVCYVYRNQLGLRLKGRKFMCEVCRFKDRVEEAKMGSYLPCWFSQEKLIRMLTKKPNE